MNKRLAIHGGTPVREFFLPYSQQMIDSHDIRSVIDVLKSDFITTGPVINEFENHISNYTNAKYTVVFSSGTAALHAACFAAGICEGDEVITTPMTFAASANSILYHNAIPVFADIDPITNNISKEAIKACLTDRTKAIIPVDYTGEPCNYEEILQIAKENNLIVIEDAAHALGASYNGQKIGSISDMTVFSFHPVKPITTGEGGAVTTNNKSYYSKLLSFRQHGITKNLGEFIDDHGTWYYEMQELGFNYRLTDIQAALGISQLQKLDYWNERRREIVHKYNEAFKDNYSIKTPMPSLQSSWHLYVIRLNLEVLKVNRKTIFDALRAENIGVNVHYIPVYYHPYYQNLHYSKGLCPNAEKLYEQIITLPLFPKMTNQDVQDVINAVYKVISHYSMGEF